MNLEVEDIYIYLFIYLGIYKYRIIYDHIIIYIYILEKSIVYTKAIRRCVFEEKIMGTWVRKSIPGLSGIGFTSFSSHKKQQTERLQMLFAFSQIWETCQIHYFMAHVC